MLDKDYCYETREGILSKGIYTTPSLNLYNEENIKILFSLVSIITKLSHKDGIYKYVSDAKELAILLCPKCK
ncbi:MAG: hypothetical protein IPM42_17565 [Saprospiraceae bacterium]|nr:hypothetical protein [Saprospiraceae bacterium]